MIPLLCSKAKGHEIPKCSTYYESLYYRPQTKFEARYCFQKCVSVILFTGDGGLCMMLLPVWLPGPMFLLGGLYPWSHVPSRVVSVMGGHFPEGGFSVRGGVSVGRPPRIRKASSTHSTGILSCCEYRDLTEKLSHVKIKLWTSSWGFSVRMGVLCPEEGLSPEEGLCRENPLPRIRKAGSIHPTGMLSCCEYIDLMKKLSRVKIKLWTSSGQS